MMKVDYVTTTYVVNQTIKKQRELEFPLDWIMKKHGNFSCLVAPTALSRALSSPLCTQKTTRTHYSGMFWKKRELVICTV